MLYSLWMFREGVVGITNDRMLTPEEAADRLALHPETVRLWLRTGRLPGIKAGRVWRVRESVLAAFMRGEKPLADETKE